MKQGGETRRGGSETQETGEVDRQARRRLRGRGDRARLGRRRESPVALGAAVERKGARRGGAWAELAWLRRAAMEARDSGGVEKLRRWLGLGHGRCGEKNSTRDYMGPPTRQNRKRKKSPEAARDQLIGRSGGGDRTLSPSVRSIPERSNSSGIATGRVRWSMTGRRQGPVSTAFPSIDRPDTGGPLNRTHRCSV